MFNHVRPQLSRLSMFSRKLLQRFFSTELLPNFNFLLHLQNIYYFFYVTYIIYIYIINPLHDLYQLLLHHTSHSSSASCPSTLSTSLSHTSASSTSHAYMTYIMHTHTFLHKSCDSGCYAAVVTQELLNRFTGVNFRWPSCVWTSAKLLLLKFFELSFFSRQGQPGLIHRNVTLCEDCACRMHKRLLTCEFCLSWAARVCRTQKRAVKCKLSVAWCLPFARNEGLMSRTGNFESSDAQLCAKWRSNGKNWCKIAILDSRTSNANVGILQDQINHFERNEGGTSKTCVVFLKLRTQPFRTKWMSNVKTGVKLRF